MTHLGAFSRLRAKTSKLYKLAKNLGKLAKDVDRGPLLVVSREIQLSQMIRAMADRVRQREFCARSYVESLPSHLPIRTNTSDKELHGGFNENIKAIFRTSIIGENVENSQLNLVTILRRDSPAFWNCIADSYLYETPMLFCETGLFGAYASAFDLGSPVDDRAAHAFLLDDMGYYFDARQSSRLETTLNDPRFSLTDDHRRRAASVIEQIIQKRITKYNKYVGSQPDDRMPSGAVLVIDQKRGDASISFARANDETFSRMLQAAVDENPNAEIWLKPHPDNIVRGVPTTADQVKILPDDTSVPDALDRCSCVYTVSSQVGFEAILRRKRTIVFGLPFYCGWGLTEDRQKVPRRTQIRSVEDLFFVSCIQQTVYLNRESGRLVDIEEAIALIESKRLEALTSVRSLRPSGEEPERAEALSELEADGRASAATPR